LTATANDETIISLSMQKQTVDILAVAQPIMTHKHVCMTLF